jgi:hypothetical protein
MWWQVVLVVTQPSKLTTIACCESLVRKLPILSAANVSPLKKDFRKLGDGQVAAKRRKSAALPLQRLSPTVSICGRQQATRCQRDFHFLREIGVATSGAWQRA